MNPKALYLKLDQVLTSIAGFLQPLFLLGVRLFWGWQFFQTGMGKLKTLDKVASFFASLHIPFPMANATIAGSVECVGGIFLLLGLCSRVIAVPLIFTMIVALATADKEAVQAIFSDPDKLTSAAPFLFLFASVIVFVFGPGKLSLDALLFKKSSAKGR
jgi:putative oxidoreductase